MEESQGERGLQAAHERLQECDDLSSYSSIPDISPTLCPETLFEFEYCGNPKLLHCPKP